MTEEDSQSREDASWWRVILARVGTGRRKVQRLLPWRLLALGGGGALLLHLFGVVQLPFQPFTTGGTIYVDSPEVYTRERLVNDRYDQDYWLRRQLALLDQVDSRILIQQRFEQDILGQGGEFAAKPRDAGETDERDSQAPMAPAVGPTFEQRFRIVSGVRDMIRQLLLENMLDDRHDLAGNSIYGLKFDTTVIPGANTRNRAYVEVTLKLDDLFAPSTFGEVPSHVRASFLRSCRNLPNLDCSRAAAGSDSGQDGARLQAQREYYDAWLDDLTKRLNLAEDAAFSTMDRPCPRRQDVEAGTAFFDQLTRRTLRTVLGIPEELFARHNPAADPKTVQSLNPVVGAGSGSFIGLNMRLPDPWAKYMTISRGRVETAPGGKPCAYRVWFDVYDVNEVMIASPESAADPELVPIHNVMIDGEVWTLQVEKFRWDIRCEIFARPFPKYSSSGLEKLLALYIVAASRPPDGAPLRFELFVPSGLFNFIESLGAVDAYSYAMFPKNDVVGILAESGTRFSGAMGNVGALGLSRRLVESRTDSVLLGFAEAGREESDGRPSVRFGWIVSASGSMQPTSKSQLALVSVPAWTNRFDLQIRTGWVGREGRPLAAQGGRRLVSVKIPPDVTSFDAIFRGDDWFTRRPRIKFQEMKEPLYVLADRRARILIPGTRLWRSATVTLGSQPAERIRVLPNMEGIIADFGPVALPQAGQETDDQLCRLHGAEFARMRARSVPVRVWTSEGVTDPLHVCVIFAPGDLTGDTRGNGSTEQAPVVAPDQDPTTTNAHPENKKNPAAK